MSYTYLQEQGEESSAASFADIPAFVLSRLNHIADKSYCRDSETDCSQGSRYGTTSGRSTAHPGADGLTSLQVDSLAKTSAPQVKEQESPESEADYGKKWQGSFTRYDRDLHSWKTHQCLLDGDLESFSETWPKWGIMRNGVCWALTMPVRHTGESGFGYWPTPRAGNPGSRRPGTGGKVLAEEAKKTSFQTPCTQDYRRRGPNSNQQGLPEQIHKMQHWPTPCATDHKGSGVNGQLRDRLDYAAERGGTKSNHSFPTPGTTGMSNGTGNCEKANQLHRDGVISDDERKSMRAGNGGQLNPSWVEWLMGWPIGWTRLESIKLDWRDWSVDPADTGEVSRVGKGIKNRVNRLKAIGNGQVPAVVRLAWNILSSGI